MPPRTSVENMERLREKRERHLSEIDKNVSPLYFLQNPVSFATVLREYYESIRHNGTLILTGPPDTSKSSLRRQLKPVDQVQARILHAKITRRVETYSDNWDIFENILSELFDRLVQGKFDQQTENLILLLRANPLFRDFPSRDEIIRRVQTISPQDKDLPFSNEFLSLVYDVVCRFLRTYLSSSDPIIGTMDVPGATTVLLRQQDTGQEFEIETRKYAGQLARYILQRKGLLKNTPLNDASILQCSFVHDPIMYLLAIKRMAEQKAQNLSEANKIATAFGAPKYRDEDKWKAGAIGGPLETIFFALQQTEKAVSAAEQFFDLPIPDEIKEMYKKQRDPAFVIARKARVNQASSFFRTSGSAPTGPIKLEGLDVTISPGLYAMLSKASEIENIVNELMNPETHFPIDLLSRVVTDLRTAGLGLLNAEYEMQLADALLPEQKPAYFRSEVFVASPNVTLEVDRIIDLIKPMNIFQYMRLGRRY